MKLSEKGLKRFWKRVNELDTFQDNHTMRDAQNSLESKLSAISKVIKQDFEPDDFKGMVCLTVDEAKDILWDLRDFYKQTYGYEWVKNEPWFDEFKNRIKRAEKSNEVE